MFQRILQWIREVWSKMINQSNVKSALRVDVAITPLMAEALQKWSLIYVNQSPWLNTEIKSLNLGAAIAAEIARVVTIEMEISISGSPRADFLAEQMVPVLNSLRTYTEYCAAKGGLMFKPYVKDKYICVDMIQADMFYPVAFDSNGNITACVFVDLKQVGQYFYRRLEYHTMGDHYDEDGNLVHGCLIINKAFRSTADATLGQEVSLSSLPEWADIKTNRIIKNINRPLFAYFKTPSANNIDPTSPLGVSVYARAVDLLEQLDRLWSGFLWEFESGKRALYTDVLAFGKDAAGKPLLPDKRLYRLLDLNSKIDGKGFFEDWTPTIREQNYINGMETTYRLIEFQCGLAEGSLPRPAALQHATATEVKMTKQRTFATITDTQKSLEDALKHLVWAMDVWATIGSLAPAGTYETTYQFDDSIVTDYDAQFTQDSTAVTLGTMPKWVFNKRNFGLTDEVAKQWVTDAQNQRVPKVVQ